MSWRWRSQCMSIISMNACPEDVFWIAKSFVTKLGMMMHRRKSNLHAEDCFDIFEVRVTMRAHILKHDCFQYIFRTAHLFTTRSCMVVHYYKPWCSVKRQACWVQVYSKGTFMEVLNLYYDRYLEHSNPIFQQSNDADNDVPANVFVCEKGPLLTSRSGTNGPSLCFVWSLTVIVTWKIANQSLQLPLQFMMMHHCATFGLKHFNSSENVIRTNVNWHF